MVNGRRVMLPKEKLLIVNKSGDDYTIPVVTANGKDNAPFVIPVDADKVVIEHGREVHVIEELVDDSGINLSGETDFKGPPVLHAYQKGHSAISAWPRRNNLEMESTKIMENVENGRYDLVALMKFDYEKDGYQNNNTKNPSGVLYEVIPEAQNHWRKKGSTLSVAGLEMNGKTITFQKPPEKPVVPIEIAIGAQTPVLPEKPKDKSTQKPECQTPSEKNLEGIKSVIGSAELPAYPQKDWDSVFQDLLKNYIGKPINNCDIDVEDSWYKNAKRGRDDRALENMAVKKNILPALEKLQKDLPNIPNPNKGSASPYLDKQNIVAVDACSRTCYAEMNICPAPYRKAAVASLGYRRFLMFGNSGTYDSRLSDNRYVANKYFGNIVDTENPLLKNPYLYTIFAPSQYSNWNESALVNKSNKPEVNNDIERKWQSNFMTSMCPPRSTTEKAFPGIGKKILKVQSDGVEPSNRNGKIPGSDLSKYPSPNEVSIYETCAKSCFDMIFRPDQFNHPIQRFEHASYTSDHKFEDPKKPEWNGMELIVDPKQMPVVDGVTLDKGKCMQFYKDKSINKKLNPDGEKSDVGWTK